MTLIFATAFTLMAADQPPLSKGQLIENVVCRNDSSQTYTLYLPSSYDQKKKWPTLLIFDPRGRSVRAAELFRSAAETYGWILISSNQTRSDGPMKPNLVAISALWPDAISRFATDPRRIYATGFSGGAHVAYLLGQRKPQLAGVIACGGRLIPQYLSDTTFAFFGVAGDTDFNYRGMRAVDALMAERGSPHRLEIFEGAHQWMPFDVAQEAVVWMEIQAMKSGLRSNDDVLVDHALATDSEKARALEEAKHLLAAERRYSAIAETFAGLRNVDFAVQRSRELSASDTVRRARDEEQRLDTFEDGVVNRLDTVCSRLILSPEPIPVESMLKELEVKSLFKQRATGGYEGKVAERLLSAVFTVTSYYLARDLRDSGRPAHAAEALAVAAAIRSDDAVVQYNLACALAQAGNQKRAIKSLERAVELGFTDLDLITNDPDLDPIRNHRHFAKIFRSN